MSTPGPNDLPPGNWFNDRWRPPPRNYVQDPKSYALSGKIMLSAIIILFTVVIVIVCLHIYARWFLLRARRRNYLRRRRRTHIVFASDLTTSANNTNRGLDASVLGSIPIFVYTSTTHDEVPECAVCLSEFAENEKGRLLPKCNHSFHIECIDMWLHSHSTCPLCRAPVNPEIPVTGTETQVENSVPVGERAETEAGSSSGLCSSCLPIEEEMGCSSASSSSNSAGSSSLGTRRKPFELMGISIEVPRRNQSFRGSEDEMGSGCSSRGQGFKSPGSGILSLKRILSRDKRPSLSPSSGTTIGCSSATEIDLERGDEEQRVQSQSLK